MDKSQKMGVWFFACSQHYMKYAQDMFPEDKDIKEIYQLMCKKFEKDYQKIWNRKDK